MRSGVPHSLLARLDTMSGWALEDQESGGVAVPTDPREDKDVEAEDGAGGAWRDRDTEKSRQ